jgi:hypothetical protein
LFSYSPISLFFPSAIISPKIKQTSNKIDLAGESWGWGND